MVEGSSSYREWARVKTTTGGGGSPGPGFEDLVNVKIKVEREKRTGAVD